ncbi:unnamed protein product [Diamesa tonsa]
MMLMILSTIFVMNYIDCRGILSISDSTNCYVDYLKRHGVYDNTLRSETFHSTTEECDLMIDAAIKSIYSDYMNYYKGSENITTCVVENMKIINWGEDALKLQMYEKFNHERLEKLAINQVETEEYFWGICAGGFNFTAAFDALLERSPVFTNEENHCIEHYFAKKDSKFHMNNKAETTIDCKTVIRLNLLQPEINLKNNIEQRNSKFTSEEIECILKAHRKNKFFDRKLKLDYMKGLGVIEERKLKEQKQYLKMMKKVATMAEKCYEYTE